MKVKGDNAPSGAFEVEPHPQKPGVAIVRLFENPEPFEEKQGELTLKGWEYDEYHLELPLYDALALDVAAAYDSYLAQAKAEERSKNELERMANSVASLQAAQSDTDSMVVEQEYRVSLLELNATDNKI
nr:MAG TPA: hypothetical protein [Caudoviricetes sp.]